MVPCAPQVVGNWLWLPWVAGWPSLRNSSRGPLRAAQHQHTGLVAQAARDLSGAGTLASSGVGGGGGDGGKVTCWRCRRHLAMANFNPALICPGGSQVLSFWLSGTSPEEACVQVSRWALPFRVCGWTWNFLPNPAFQHRLCIHTSCGSSTLFPPRKRECVF